MSSDNAVSSDNAYEALSEGGGDGRWAYGTGFADPLEGVDTAVPAGTDAADLAAYCPMLGDDNRQGKSRRQRGEHRGDGLEPSE